jgi:hypothetical protein
VTAGPDRPAAGEGRNPDLDPVLSFPSPAAWADWLAREHARSSGVWLKVARKESGAGGVGYQEALDVALPYGWIDGRKRRLDDRHWLQRFTPRGPRSGWSKVNRERVERLIEAGEMRPAGLREVERAKADGRWQAAYDPPSRAAVPEDLGGPWPPTSAPGPASPPWTAATATPSCTASRRRSGRRRGPGASRRTWPC